MTRTDVVASSRPHTPTKRAGGRRSRRLARALLALPVLLLAFALLSPSAAVAASEPTSGYSSKPEEPKTKEEPKTGTSPSKEEKSSTPSSNEEPSKENEPAASKGEKASEKASTLPFTGFDLRWSIAIGVLLMGAGFTIVVVQRRQRGSS